MMVPSWLCPIYFLAGVWSGAYKSSTTSARTSEGHKLNEPHGNVLFPGHLYKIGDFGVVDVLYDDSVQFYRLEV